MTDAPKVTTPAINEPAKQQDNQKPETIVLPGAKGAPQPAPDKN